MNIIIRALVLAVSAASSLTHAQACDPQETGIFYVADHSHRDFFGVEVQVDTEWMMITAGSNTNSSGEPAVYVYRLIDNKWESFTTLTSPNPLGRDSFGDLIKIYGDRAFISAIYDDDIQAGSGALYEYVFNGTDWMMVDKIKPNVPIESDGFGRSITVSEDGNTMLVTSMTQNFSGENTGSAYVFERVDGTWVQQHKLNSSNQTNADWFGATATMLPSGNTIVVAALAGSDVHGSFYVFDRQGSNWVERDEYLASDSQFYSYFGNDITSDEHQIIIGAPNALDPDDFPPTWVGAAYVFEFDGTDWVQTQQLTAPDGDANDWFGSSVHVVGDRLLVGADQKAAAYLYERIDGQWQFSSKIQPSGVIPESGGVHTFAMGTDHILFSEFIGINSGSPAGGAYLFELNCESSSCPADLNGDGMLNFFDVTAFIVAFNTQDPLADFNADGEYNFFDVPIFIAAFQAGCP